jgi:uncharacterized delta-60 repeat protein
MKYQIMLKLILFLCILFIFARPYKSEIEKNQKEYQRYEKNTPFPDLYLPGIEKGNLSQSRERSNKPHDIYPDEMSDRPREQLGLSALSQNYNNRGLLQDHVDRMRKQDFQYNSNIPGSFKEQNSSFADSIEEAWISHYGSGLAPAYDVATDIVTDSSGNIYITGYSTKKPYGVDYYTEKLNNLGERQWSVRYDGGFADLAAKIEIDCLGNVYVTGYSWGLGTDYDYATVKYNNVGVEQWVARYDGPGNGYDRPYALAVDKEGNVYVAGSSYDSENFDDYATVKYNTMGEEQWFARYNGPGNGYDGANDVTVDIDGNVYVTGCVFGSGTEYDYGTIKYNSKGVELWTAFYNGPANNRDYATAIAVDKNCNVYITGTSFNSIIECDYATLKYNTIGKVQWIVRYNGPGNFCDFANALTIDEENNVYITGSSCGSGTFYDFATLKYNTAGELQWLARYNGPGNSYDYAYSLNVDESRNVYVTGSSASSHYNPEDYATVKYNSMGEEKWAVNYDGLDNAEDLAYAQAVDELGNVYVTGGSWDSETVWDYVTIKYDADGVHQWTARYNGPGNAEDLAYALAVDGNGNVYVTGSSMVLGNWYDYATVKYNATGEKQWTVLYDGSGNFLDYANAIAVDGQGNVYVTGCSYGIENNSDYVTVKYNASGAEQWSARYNSQANDHDGAFALAVDGQGNVYVTGSSIGSGTDEDYTTIKYNASGVEQWAMRYNGPGNYEDRAYKLAIDSVDNVYVTGGSYGLGTSEDYTTIKYNASGVEQWIARYNYQGNEPDRAYALAVDGEGNVYVTGSSRTSETYFDCATLKYNSAGEEQWAARYNNPENGSDGAKTLAVDSQGNVYITGYSLSGRRNTDYITVKYNSMGEEQWSALYNAPGNDDDNVNALAIDDQDNVYVTGRSYSSETNYDYATLKYNTDGVNQWIARYNSPGNGRNYANALAVDGQGNVYVAGISYGVGWHIVTTIKYTQTSTGFEQKVLNKPVIYKLAQNYPNPFNPSTTIEFSIPKTEYVTLKIYNLLGQEVAALVSEKLTYGNYIYTWDASGLSSGVYYYRIITDTGYEQSRKLLLMK